METESAANHRRAASRESGFTPKGSSPRAALPFILRPRGAPGFAIFESDNSAFETYVLHTVLNKIDAELARAIPLETIGLLAGRVMCDPEGPYTLVLACEDARGDEIEATPGHVRITAEGHAKLRRRLELTALGLDLVGWYHSHPTFPARFSSVDTIEQSTLRDPNHIGIVVSGIDNLKPYGVYRGPAALQLAAQTQIRRPFEELSSAFTAKAAATSDSVSIATEASPLPLQQAIAPAYSAAPLPHARRPRRSTAFLWQAFAAACVLALGFAVWITLWVNSVENRLTALGKQTAEAVNRQSDAAKPTQGPDNVRTPGSAPAEDAATGTADLPANPKLPFSEAGARPQGEGNPSTRRVRQASRPPSALTGARRTRRGTGASRLNQGQRQVQPNNRPSPR